jgi:6-phosphogluconolactonase
MELHPVIEIYHSTRELEQNAAERIVLMINKAIGARGVCFIALSGGETPRPVYRLLGTAQLRVRVDWSGVHLFFADERVVPSTDPLSNDGMIERELISHINIPRKNVHRIEGEKKPELAAAEYERQLQQIIFDRDLQFDIIILGLGEDGHTASIFPGTEVVEEKRALASAVFVPHLGKWRVTLTFRSINNAREILFLVSGKKKARVVQQVLQAADPPEKLPATMVHPFDGTIRWMLDQDAAGNLRPGIPYKSEL